RRAAARRDRPRAGQRPAGAAGRRANRQPRRARHSGRVPVAAGHQRQRHGGGDGNPRPRPGTRLGSADSRAARGQAGVRLRGGPGGGTVNLLWREALLSFRRTRTLSILSVTTIAFALFVTGLFGLVAVNLRKAISDIEERVEVVAFVLRGTPTQTLAVAIEDITAFPEVLSVRYVSEDEALSRAREELVEFREAYDDLEINPLPPSVEIRLRPGFRDSPTAATIAERLNGFPFVEEVRYGRDWVEQLDRLRTIAGVIGLSIGLAFALVSIVIIGITIRITVLHRAREIGIMRLVG